MQVTGDRGRNHPLPTILPPLSLAGRQLFQISDLPKHLPCGPGRAADHNQPGFNDRHDSGLSTYLRFRSDAKPSRARPSAAETVAQRRIFAVWRLVRHAPVL